MSATTIVSPGPAGHSVPGLAATNWIISKKDDLTWFIGSGLAGYAALALMKAGFPLMLLYVIWFIGVDGPHVIGTVTRTYFDRQERGKLGWWLWAIVPLMAVGPAMVLGGQGSWFFLFAVIWQHFHIAKQHVGFVMLWKAKNKERDAWERNLDRWFLLISTTLPLVLFVIRTRVTWEPAMIGARVLTAAYVLCAAAYVIHQVRKFQKGIALNAPKLMLLAVLVPLQWIAFGYAEQFGPDGTLRAGIALGLFHSFQYHRLLWFHNKNRYQVPGAREKHGLAVYFARNFGTYMTLAIGLHFLISPLPQFAFPSMVLSGALWGVAFTHYVLDAKIWHVRGDKELAQALHM